MQGFASLGAGAGRAADAALRELGEDRLDAAQVRELDRFLAGVERRAFRIAQFALRDTDDAHDVVQVAMLRLAQSYGSRPAAEWKPLFYRILYNGIRDLQRRHGVRRRFFGLLPGAARQTKRTAARIRSSRCRIPPPGPCSSSPTDEAMRQLGPGTAPVAGATARGVLVALPGGSRRGGDGRRDGLQRRQREDTLFPRVAGAAR